jgi:hypothetical protein
VDLAGVEAHDLLGVEPRACKQEVMLTSHQWKEIPTEHRDLARPMVKTFIRFCGGRTNPFSNTKLCLTSILWSTIILQPIITNYQRSVSCLSFALQ